MSGRSLVGAVVLVLGTLSGAGAVDAQIPQLVVVADDLPDPPRTELVRRRATLVAERDALRARVEAHNARCRSVVEPSAAADGCRAAQGPLNQTVAAHVAVVRAFNDDVALAGGPPPLASPQIDRIVREIRNIRVPPPIMPDEVAIKFGQLPPSDPAARHGFFGVALLELALNVGGTVVPPAKVIIVPTKIAVAMAEGADLYVTRQTSTYERALVYLKDPATRERFGALVHALREHGPIPENASIEMAKAAQAVADVGAGNTTHRVFWNAMWSPEAKAAGLTRIAIEAGSELVGHAGKQVLKQVTVAREPAYQMGTRALATLEPELASATTPAARATAQAAIRDANALIAGAYRMHERGLEGMQIIMKTFAEERENAAREQRR